MINKAQCAAERTPLMVFTSLEAAVVAPSRVVPFRINLSLIQRHTKRLKQTERSTRLADVKQNSVSTEKQADGTKSISKTVHKN